MYKAGIKTIRRDAIADQLYGYFQRISFGLMSSHLGR